MTGTTEGTATAGGQPISVLAAKVLGKPTHHLSICICTFKRAELLKRLLTSLVNQHTEGLFSYSIVVADNDVMQSARRAVDEFSLLSPLPITYCMEPQQNIALVRNRALAHADGDFAVFIDDDEFPADNWLHNLLKTYFAYGADGVLGPVKPCFEHEPPQWVKKGRFFERPAYATGYQLTWPETRTGNVLFRKNIVDGFETPFNPEFATAGEDVDFFRRLMEKGYTFVWCNEAIAYEVVPPFRCTRSYLLKRALLRGSNFPKHPRRRVQNITRSLVAVPCYTLALPVLLIFGQDVFVTYLSKLLDHVSRLLAFLGVPLVKERQT